MLDNLNALTDNLSNYSSAILLFFFLISSNYLGGLFSCSVKRLFGKRWAVHALALVTMFVSVINANSGSSENVGKQLLMSVALYAIFVAMTKGKLVFNLVVIGLLVGIFLLTQYLNNTDVTNEEQASQMDMLYNIRSLLLVALVGTCVIGSVRYYLTKKGKFGSGFNPLTFWLGTDNCTGL